MILLNILDIRYFASNKLKLVFGAGNHVENDTSVFGLPAQMSMNIRLLVENRIYRYN